MSTTSFPTVPLEKIPPAHRLHRRQDVWPLAFVVDDEPVITETLKAILNRSGVATICANCGADAVDLASVVPPDLLITDYRMPGMNGIELAAHVKQLAPTCEIILFSGNLTVGELGAEAAKTGLEMTMLAKPVHPARMLELVKARLLARQELPVF